MLVESNSLATVKIFISKCLAANEAGIAMFLLDCFNDVRPNRRSTLASFPITQTTFTQVFVKVFLI